MCIIAKVYNNLNPIYDKIFTNLLIVDDNDSNLALLEVVLGKLQGNLIKASSGIEALEKSKGQELALAILDIQMPGMNGFELAVKINAERGNNKVPIIFVTANHVNEIDVSQGYGSGAVDYIFKPINKHIMTSKVNVFLDLFNHKQTIIREAKILEKTTNELIWVNAALKRSEVKYRSYIENAPDGVFVIDEKGRYTDINEAICRITGYSKDELLKMSIVDLLPVEFKKIGLIHFRTLVNSGNLKVDIPFRHKNGTKRWWVLEAVNLTDTLFLCYTKDITHRKELEESLKAYQIELEKQNNELERQNEEIELAKNLAEIVSHKYTQLYDFAPTGYFTLSITKKIEEINHSGAILLGSKRKHLKNCQFESFISADTLPIFNSFFQDILNSKTKFTCEIIIQTVDNESRNVHLEGIFDESIEKCLINVIDISERIKADKALNKISTRLKLATRAGGVGVWDLDFVNNKLIWDDQMHVLYGVEKLDIEDTYDYWLSGIHPEDKARGDSEILQAINDEKEFDIEFRVIWPDGSIHNLRALAIVLRDEAGKPLHMIGTNWDITEIKKNEQELKISEEKYRTMLNASPDGILLIDLNKTITEVSEIGLELFDTEKREDLIGKNFYQFIPADETELINDIFEKTVSEGLVQNAELIIRKKNQSTFQSEVSSTLIQASDGEPLSFMITIRDISQRKKIETKQIHADRMANLGEMASGIAHEINQPLNIISMVMDKILFEADKTETINIEFLKTKSDKIFDNITRIRNIIDHVRAFSRNDDNYILTAFDINSSIENAVSMITEQYKHLDISLNTQLGQRIPQIVGNTYKFEQVMVNLLTNAKDAVLERRNRQEDYCDLKVGIRTYLENQSLIVEIIDNGIGIHNDDIHNIMLPFYTTKEEGKGTGLGLSICYQIIKEMHGTIDISSDGVNGTKIKIVLDIKKTN